MAGQAQGLCTSQEDFHLPGVSAGLGVLSKNGAETEGQRVQAGMDSKSAPVGRMITLQACKEC